MKSVVITGGGLAGLSLGIALRRRQVPVILKEAGSYPRHRVCGEFITGISREKLETLGIGDSFSQALELKTVAWFSGADLISRKRLPRTAWGVSRWVLDQTLAKNFTDLCGDLRTGAREKRVESTSEEGIVWAAGRNPCVTRRGRRWIGLKVHLNGVSLEEDLELHLGQTGYAGISRIEEGNLNLCGLFRQDTAIEGRGVDLMRQYLQANRLERLVDLIDRGTIDDSSFSGVSAMNYGLLAAPQRGFVLGDNWSLIPPFTGNGMSMAFESALIAVDPLSKWAAGEIDWDTALQFYRRKLSRSLRGRVLRARGLHGMLLLPSTRVFLAWLARKDVLPFRILYSLTH